MDVIGVIHSWSCIALELGIALLHGSCLIDCFRVGLYVGLSILLLGYV